MHLFCALSDDIASYEASEVRIGTMLRHKDVGVIIVTGIYTHCGGYAVDYQGGWVYLANCVPYSVT